MAEELEVTDEVSAAWPLSYDEAGQGGEPLMLVHGFTGGRADFAEWVEPLADFGRHVVVPDLRGHGTSGGPDGADRYDLEAFASDVLDLADRLGWGRFGLLGHSMGGMVAQRVALRAPDRLTSLVLMDTHHGPVGGMDPALVELAIEVATTEGMEALATAMDQLGGSPLETEPARRLRLERPDLAAIDRAKLVASHPDMYASMARQLVGGADRLEALATLAVPTLVIVGDQDRPFIDASRAMAAAIPGARLVEVADAGHSPQREAPDAWWRALSEFLVSSSSPEDGDKDEKRAPTEPDR